MAPSPSQPTDRGAGIVIAALPATVSLYYGPDMSMSASLLKKRF